MNKTQIVKAVNSQLEAQTINSITEVINTVIAVITTSLRENKDEKVSIQNFLTIENILQKAKSGEFQGVAWKTEEKLVPKAKLMKKFIREVQDGKK